MYWPILNNRPFSALKSVFLICSRFFAKSACQIAWVGTCQENSVFMRCLLLLCGLHSPFPHCVCTSAQPVCRDAVRECTDWLRGCRKCLRHSVFTMVLPLIYVLFGIKNVILHSNSWSVCRWNSFFRGKSGQRRAFRFLTGSRP